MAPSKEASICLACSKKFGKSDFSVQCTVCGLWIHKSCANLTDEMFKFLDDQFKLTGTAFWACRACTQYAKQMNHKMREIETKLDLVKETCQKNEGGLKRVQEEVAKLSEKVELQSRKVEEARAAAVTSSSTGVFQELRERESKRNNVIMHGMGEAPPDRTGRARWDWDVKSCENLFNALHLTIKADGIRFVRRVGELGEHPRPLVVGFHEERDKARVLRADTRKTRFRDVDIAPDLTKTQREEDDAVRVEMVNRNKRMSSEDRSKNLAWAVVGPRGAKRLVKRRIDCEEEMAAGRRSRARQRPRPDPLQPAAATSNEHHSIVELEGREQEDPGGQTLLEEVGRNQLGSKRGRGGSTEVDEPPQARAKH